MNRAFLLKNFRKLNFEEKTIFAANFFSAIFCFFPWLSVVPAYGDAFFFNAFLVPSFLIGVLIFLISAAISAIFFDKIAATKKIKLPFSEKNFLAVATVEQIIFLILGWSVLFSAGKDFKNSEIGFGFFIVFALQIASSVAVFLDLKNESRKKAQNFMNFTDEKNAEKNLTEKNEK